MSYKTSSDRSEIQTQKVLLLYHSSHRLCSAHGLGCVAPLFRTEFVFHWSNFQEKLLSRILCGEIWEWEVWEQIKEEMLSLSFSIFDMCVCLFLSLSMRVLSFTSLFFLEMQLSATLSLFHSLSNCPVSICLILSFSLSFFLSLSHTLFSEEADFKTEEKPIIESIWGQAAKNKRLKNYSSPKKKKKFFWFSKRKFSQRNETIWSEPRASDSDFTIKKYLIYLIAYLLPHF